MPFAEIIRLSVEALAGHKFRTLLTMLGMVIGVLAVVLLVSIGQGAKNYVLSEFQGMGTNLIIVQPGKTDKKGSMGPPIGAAQRRMTTLDVTAIEKRAYNVEAVSGVVMGTASVRYDTALSNVTVFGTNEQFPNIINIDIEEGIYFSREEDEYGRRVAVLGANVAKNLFADESGLGRAIKFNQSEFRVVGIMSARGSKLGFNLDEIALIPTHAAMRLFNDDKLFGIRAKASSRTGVDDAVAEVTEILKDRRDGEEDFTVVTQLSMMESMTTILNMLTYVLAGIAAISMLVGGIGIMNIMLVSVSERIPEIGVRRAVGARRRDIMVQFLTEAVALSFVSAVVGVGIALLLTHGMHAFFPNFDMRAPWWIVPPAFLLSVIVGVVFGVVPARRAAHIETLDALRYE